MKIDILHYQVQLHERAPITVQDIGSLDKITAQGIAKNSLLINTLNFMAARELVVLPRLTPQTARQALENLAANNL